MTARRGVLFIAMGERYRREALVSMRSLRVVSPDLGIAVVTEEKDSGIAADYLLLADGVFSLASKPRYMSLSPFEETLFVDTDTFFARDVRPLFGLLRHYDLCVQFGGCQFNGADGLEFHARACSGAILFRKSKRVEDLMSDWNLRYESEKREKGIENLADERALTEAIAHSEARVGVLNDFVHVNLGTPSVFMSPPVILHGRLPSFRHAARSIARKWDPPADWAPRVWLPSLRGLLPRGVRRSDPLLAAALLLRRAWNELRMLLSKAWEGRG